MPFHSFPMGLEGLSLIDGHNMCYLVSVAVDAVSIVTVQLTGVLLVTAIRVLFF